MIKVSFTKWLVSVLICVPAVMCVALFSACSPQDDDEKKNNTKSGATKTIAGIECVLVKAGTFWMGSPESEEGHYDYEGRSRETQHQVTLTKDYWISKYEVTQAQFEAVMCCPNPSYFIGDDFPVENVTWSEAVEFCKKVGGRLPTEAEWEFAARGGNESRGYIYSGSNNLDEVGWYGGGRDDYGNLIGNSDGTPHPVGTKLPNELGIYDMSGNVYEWCSDRYDFDYGSSPQTDPTGPNSGSDRVARGGSWSGNSQYCRVADRGNHTPDNRGGNLGLRVAFNSY